MTEKEFIIEDVSATEVEILESCSIEWCPDDIYGSRRDIILFTEEEYHEALRLLGRN